MKIELTEEERLFLLRLCVREKSFTNEFLLDYPDTIAQMIENDLESIINKLSAEKCEK